MTTRPAIGTRSIWVGMGLVLIFVGGFLAWAILAPLDSAATASGQVVVISHRKTIQHLEGGIIRDIAVHDGQVVSQNQILIRLDDAVVKTQLALLATQRLSLDARLCRLNAEKEGKSAIVFDQIETKWVPAEKVKKILDGENRFFLARKGLLAGQLKVIKEKIKQYKSEILGIGAQRIAVHQQLVIINQQLEEFGQLVEDGYMTKEQKTEVEKQKAELKGKAGELSANVAQIGQTISGARMEMLNLIETQLNEVIKDIQDLQPQLADLDERFRATVETYSHMLIRAPSSGKIFNLAYHTKGGIIEPGKPILEIVPQNERLVVDARVSPQDIDSVSPGQKVMMIFSAFNANKVPPVKGELTYIAADVMLDSNGGNPFFPARVEIDPAEYERLAKLNLQSGMQAEIQILTGKRTFIQYLTTPLTDTFRRAFKEN